MRVERTLRRMNRVLGNVCLCLALLYPSPVLGTKGTVVFAQNPSNPKKKNDTVCVERENKRIQCGRVMEATAKELTVNFDMAGKGVELLPDEPSEGIPSSKKTTQGAQPPTKARSKKRKLATERGSPAPSPAPQKILPPLDKTTPPPVNAKATPEIETPTVPTEPRSPTPSQTVALPIGAFRTSLPRRAESATRHKASIDGETSTAKTPLAKPRLVNVGLGVKGGNLFFYPHVYGTFMATKRVGLGAKLIYGSGSSASTDLTIKGGAVSVSYFLSEQPFGGLHLDLDAGILLVNLTKDGTPANFTPLFGAATANWAFTSTFGLHFSAGAGVEYVSGSRPDLITYSDLEAVLTLRIGYCF